MASQYRPAWYADIPRVYCSLLVIVDPSNGRTLSVGFIGYDEQADEMLIDKVLRAFCFVLDEKSE